MKIDSCNKLVQRSFYTILAQANIFMKQKTVYVYLYIKKRRVKNTELINLQIFKLKRLFQVSGVTIHTHIYTYIYIYIYIYIYM